MRTRDEWESWYRQPNPWHYDGTLEDEVRTSALLERLQHAHFDHALDVGCGEGRLINALTAIADHVTGFDISATAIERAQTRYPHIRFHQGDLLDVVRRPDVLAIPFDLVVASEVLYYLPTDDERKEAVAGLSHLGTPSCLFYFSVIVTGASAGRRYFTHDGFASLLSEHFTVIDSFPSVASFPRALTLLGKLVRSSQKRVQLMGRWNAASRPEHCRHMGYFALRRQGAPISATLN